MVENQMIAKGGGYEWALRSGKKWMVIPECRTRIAKSLDNTNE